MLLDSSEIFMHVNKVSFYFMAKIYKLSVTNLFVVSNFIVTICSF